ncbi:MAG: hypothetical protein MJ244_02335 [Clostridia bacterium]|nr:hypothetical protein [Clostridia bacterium]
MGNETKKNVPQIGYGLLDKGVEYSTSNYLKAPSSNTKSIVFDTGKSYIPGACYDHHQLSEEEQVLYPSATAMVYAYADEIYKLNKDAIDNGMKINLVCHENPDPDAILSVALAKYVLEHEGELPACAKDIVKHANESDTFTFKPGFNFGSLLKTIIQEENKNTRNIMQKKEAIDTCVSFVELMIEQYDKQLERTQSEEAAKNLNLNGTLKTMMKPSSRYRQESKAAAANWRYFNKIEDTIKKKTTDSIAAFDTMVDNQSSRDAEYNNGEMKARDQITRTCSHTMSQIASYELIDVNLCKAQITKEDQEKEFESAVVPSNVFIYTGSKPFDPVMDLRAKENFDVTIIPKYDYEKGFVTIKISSQVEGLNLGHFGRYIESLMYQENLDKSKSPLSGDAFKRRKEGFIKSLKPYDEEHKDKHYTTFESKCGTGQTFFGYSAKLDSNLAQLTYLTQAMKDYFEEPHKINQEEFEEIVGKENIDEVNKIVRGEHKQEVKKKKTIIYTNSSKTVQKIERPIKKTFEEKVAEEIVDANIDEEDIDNILNDVLDENPDLGEDLGDPSFESDEDKTLE